MKAHSTKSLHPEPVKQEFGKNCKILTAASVMMYFFNKIADIKYTFATIHLYYRLYHLWFLATSYTWFEVTLAHNV